MAMLLILLLLVGCRHESQTALLAEAEAFLPFSPDSADARLKHIDTKLLQGDDDEAYYALLRTRTDALQKFPVFNDTLVERAYTYYKRKSHGGTVNNGLEYFAQAALYMGDWHAEKGDTKQSENCYRQALIASEKSEDWRTCYISYSRLAAMVQWTDGREAVRLSEKAIKTYERCNDDINNLIILYEYAANYHLQMAHVQGADSCFSSALEYAYKAHNLAKDSCLEMYSNETLVSLAEIYWSMGDYSRALQYVSEIKIQNLDSENAQRMNMKLARYYLSCDSLAKAKQLYLAPEHIENKLNKYLYMRGLAEVAIKQDMPGDSILYCMNSALKSAEDNYLDALQQQYEYYHELLEKEKNNAKLVYDNKLRTWIFVGIIAIVLISSLLLCRMLFLGMRMRKEQLRISIMQRKHELEMSIEERHRTKSENLLLQEQQRSKEQETLFLHKEMQLLQDKQQALAESHQKKSAIIRHLQKYIIDRADVTMKLKENVVRVRMSAKDWNEVEQLLDEIDDRSISKMRSGFKNLTTDDIRLCIMVRLGMSNPAIGNVFAITPSAVQHRKRALRQRCFGVQNPGMTLGDFIASL